MSQEPCKEGGPTKQYGNCTNLGPDGLVAQCVGPWAKDKHDYLRRYIEATRATRSKYLTPAAAGVAGGAAFIDLFAGPGRSRVRTSGEIIDGSPLIAAQHAESPFTKLILVDLAEENITALEVRLNAISKSAELFHGDCNQVIDNIVKRVPTLGLNIALIDPYGLRPLSFETIAKLAAFKRMDLVMHFPTMDIKRNFATAETYITKYLGTDVWKHRVRSPQQVVSLIDVLREQLAQFGYMQDKVRSLPVENRQGAVLYHLVYATKDKLGNKIWDSIARISAKGQKTLPGL
jgi:three-Cys-motif partner protein